MLLRYHCENEYCENYEEEVELPPGKTAECEGCGWLLTPAD